MLKKRIVIAGIGGVGGYYGGMLSRKFENNPTVDVFFFARGEHLEKIQKEGLLVKSAGGTFRTKPTLATDNASQIGEADYILIASKSYDLEVLLSQLKPCIGTKTMLLPLLNGISITQIIRGIHPENEVLYGCVYIIARLTEPGVIQTFWSNHELFLGTDHPLTDEITKLNSILQEAQIKAKLLPDILTKVWEKFLRISTFATATSYFDCGFCAVIANAEQLTALHSLMQELMEVAHAEKITLRKELPEETITAMQKSPVDSTSSMHSDFKSGRKTELATLTGVVLDLAKKHNIAVPMYSKMYAALAMRQ